jgi:CheY-like chemotaxis protein
MMGGKLIVESTPGIGSKFSFDLTFDTIDMTDDELREKKIIFNELEKPMFEGEVLLCEDNVMNQQVICEHLARVGLKTVVADNGKEGVDMVKDRKEKSGKQFDLVFMDIHMPVMDGLEASAKIIEIDSGIPIIAMTANIMSNDMEIYKASGMHDCVGKPFTSQELWRCLMKYFTPITGGAIQKSIQVEQDMDFQISLLKMFVKNNRGKYEEIIKALEESDIKLAHRLAHTLKSNAGQIGKAVLQQAAAEVEAMLKDGVNHVAEEQLKVLENELNMVLNEFAYLLNEQDDAANAEQVPAIGLEKAQELFEKLEPLLKRGNPECLNLADELRAIPESTRMIQQMEDFRFELALSSLAELKEKMGLN